MDDRRSVAWSLFRWQQVTTVAVPTMIVGAVLVLDRGRIVLGLVLFLTGFGLSLLGQLFVLRRIRQWRSLRRPVAAGAEPPPDRVVAFVARQHRRILLGLLIGFALSMVVGAYVGWLITPRLLGPALGLFVGGLPIYGGIAAFQVYAFRRIPR